MEPTTNKNSTKKASSVVAAAGSEIYDLRIEEAIETTAGQTHQLEASDLFSLFTADIIKQETIFTR